MDNQPDIRELLPQEIQLAFDDTIEVTLGKSTPKTWLFSKGPYHLTKLLFPDRKFQPRNTFYLAIPTWDETGARVDVSLRRAFKDLEWREQGLLLPKGFSVETKNGNKLDLRTDNLKAIPASQVPRKNSWKAHYLIGIRLKALVAGQCPDEAMARVVATNLESSAANDNEESEGDRT